MGKEIDGLFVFSDRDMQEKDHPAIQALKNVSLGDVKFPYGFRLATEDGKTIVWPLERQDYLDFMYRVNPNLDHDKLIARDATSMDQLAAQATTAVTDIVVSGPMTRRQNRTGVVVCELPLRLTEQEQVGWVLAPTFAYSPYLPSTTSPAQSSCTSPRRTSRWKDDSGQSRTAPTSPCFTGLIQQYSTCRRQSSASRIMCSQ